MTDVRVDRPRRAFVDLDGVLADFQTSAALLHGVDLVALRASNLDILDFTGMDKPTFYAPLGAGFWRGLNWTAEGRQILAMVESFFDQRNICILTSAVDTDGCYDGKKVWIRQHLPAYRRQFYIGPDKRFCANQQSVLLDDRDTVLSGFAEEGGHVICVPRAWNRAAGRSVLQSVEDELRALCG